MRPGTITPQTDPSTGFVRIIAACSLFVAIASCGPRPPSEVEIKRAYAVRTKPAAHADGTPMPVYRGKVVEAASSDCKYGYNRYFTRPVVIADREPNGTQDTHCKVVVMIEWADGWQVREVK